MVPKSKKRQAFTLIEMIIVLVILAILVVLVVPQVSSYIGTAKETAALHNARAVMNAADLAMLDMQNKGMATPTIFDNGALDEYLENTRSKELTYSVQVDGGRVSGGQVTTDGIAVQLPALQVIKDHDNNN